MCKNSKKVFLFNLLRLSLKHEHDFINLACENFYKKMQQEYKFVWHKIYNKSLWELFVIISFKNNPTSSHLFER